MPKAPLKRPPAKDVGSEKPTPDSLLDNLAQVAIDDDRCAMGVGAFAGLIYLATMHRTLAGGDSGDLIANACSLGVPHPPGYPLHTLLAALFVRLIPFGSPALRVNLLSVLAAAAAAAQLFRAALVLVRVLPPPKRKTTAGMARWACAFGVLTFAFSPLTWTYSTHAEVFAINNMLVASLLLFTLRFSLNRDPREATAAALTIGLGISNQHTFVFFAFPAVCWALCWLAVSKKLLQVSIFVQLGLWGLAGLIPYLFMAWSGTQAIQDSWGDTGTGSGFVRHLFRAEYGTFKLYPGADQARNHLGEVLLLWIAHIWEETLFVGPFLIAAGVYSSLASKGAARRGGLVLLSLAVFYFLGFHSLSNLPLQLSMFRGVMKRFWMQLNASLALFLAPGFLWALNLLGGNGRRGDKAHGPIAVLLIACQIGRHYGKQDMSQAPFVENYGRGMLNALPYGALALTQGDINVHTIRYLQACEGVRPDIIFLDQVQMAFGWYSKQQAPRLTQRGVVFPGNTLMGKKAPAGHYSWQQFLQANLRDDRAMFSCGGWAHPDERLRESAPDGFQFVSPTVGVCERIFKDNTEVNVTQMVEMGKAARREMQFKYPDARNWNEDTWEHHIVGQLWKKRESLGANMLSLYDRSRNHEALQIAVDEYRDITAKCTWKTMPYTVWKQLGAALSHQAGITSQVSMLQATVLQKESVDAFRMFVKLSPDSDPDKETVFKHLRLLDEASSDQGGLKS